MTTKKLIISAILVLICSTGFCLDLEGKRDGIHKEYYENGKLKFEYMVKDEKLDSFFEKYDENGELEYREYYKDGMFDGVDRSNYYYPLFFWYQHIGEEAEEVVLTDEEEILDIFAEDYELSEVPLEGNWMGIVRTRVPTGGNSEREHPVTLAGISKNYIYLKEYKARDDIEPMRHYFYDLIRKYKVKRSPDVDDLFNVAYIEEIFQRRNTGVEYGTPFGTRKIREGSRLKSVQQYMGDPDYEYRLKPSGWFDVYYANANLRILGHSSAVYYIEGIKPDWADSPEYRYKRETSFDRRIKRLKEDQD